jgi:hypothetical protein
MTGETMQGWEVRKYETVLQAPRPLSLTVLVFTRDSRPSVYHWQPLEYLPGTVGQVFTTHSRSSVNQA